MHIPGSRILVTGAAVRIGRAIATVLSNAGADLVIHYHRRADEAEELAEILRVAGGRADTVCGDLSHEAGCRDVLRQALARGPLDGLVNNASVYHRGGLAETGEDALLREFGPNLFGPLALMRGFAAQRRAGAVVNLLDRRVAAHDAGAAAYHLSKVALAEATRLAAIEFAPLLRVNAVAPGAILPPPGVEDSAYLAQHGGRAPLAHRCSPSDVADAVLFLLRAPAITGQILFVDGGQHLLGNGV
jgi:pteridine reductase